MHITLLACKKSITKKRLQRERPCINKRVDVDVDDRIFATGNINLDPRKQMEEFSEN